jgi:hypothetical protein
MVKRRLLWRMQGCEFPPMPRSEDSKTGGLSPTTQVPLGLLYRVAFISALQSYWLHTLTRLNDKE